MKFTRLKLIGFHETNLPVVGALPSDPYIFKGADGLGPPEIDVIIANTLNAGGYYQGRRPQTREIVIRIGLNPDFGSSLTAADLRGELYGLLSPNTSDAITIQILNENQIVAYTTGYVKKLEIAPFSPTPEVQVTIASLYSYLLAPDSVSLAPANLAVFDIENLGTAPTPFYMEILFRADTSQFILTDDLNRPMKVTYDFKDGERLVINTEPGSRGVWRIHNENKTSIIHALSTDSIWHVFHSGTNRFGTNVQTFEWRDFHYTPRYWGI
jgi:hypothetical protein